MASETIISESNPQKLICADLDEFFAEFDETGVPRGTPHVVKPLEAEFLPPSTREEAEFVRHVFDVVYEGTYPFPEMLDPDWVYEKFFDPNYFWGIYRISKGYPGEGTPIGCFTQIIDVEHASGYMRGLLLLPEYQQQFNLREILMRMMWHLFEKTKDRIFKWYGESRTAHNKTQYFISIAGGKTHAILLNKDYFYHLKESDALMVAYSHDALTTKRFSAQFLIPEVLPIYNHFRSFEQLNPVLGAEFKIKIKGSEVQAILQRLEIEIETDRHGYITISIKDPIDGRNILTGLCTPSVRNIEKIHYHAVSPESLLALITYLSVYTKIQQIEYVEWYVIASDLIAQRLLKDWGFLILGYLPAWEPKATLNQFEDVVIFGWTKVLPQFGQIKLLDDGIKLLSKILPPN